MAENPKDTLMDDIIRALGELSLSNIRATINPDRGSPIPIGTLSGIPRPPGISPEDYRKFTGGPRVDWSQSGAEHPVGAEPPRVGPPDEIGPYPARESELQPGQWEGAPPLISPRVYQEGERAPASGYYGPRPPYWPESDAIRSYPDRDLYSPAIGSRPHMPGWEGTPLRPADEFYPTPMISPEDLESQESRRLLQRAIDESLRGPGGGRTGRATIGTNLGPLGTGVKGERPAPRRYDKRKKKGKK